VPAIAATCDFDRRRSGRDPGRRRAPRGLGGRRCRGHAPRRCGRPGLRAFDRWRAGQGRPRHVHRGRAVAPSRARAGDREVDFQGRYLAIYGCSGENWRLRAWQSLLLPW